MSESLQPSLSNLRSLQILRLIACTSVVYYHIYAQPNFGLFGVDIFFVLSGFVIALVIQNQSSPKQFAINRISRIVPIYWILTTVLFLLICVHPSIVRKSTAETATVILYLKSLFFVAYYDVGQVKPPLLRVGWTLNYEIFFYACVWLSLVLFKKKAIKPITILIGGTFVAPFFIASSNPFFQEFFGSHYILEFLLGMLVLYVYKCKHLKLPSDLCPFIAIGSYALMAYIDANDISGNRLLYFGAPSTLLLLAMLGNEDFYAKSSSKVILTLTLMGDASYATYLSHFFFVEGFKRIACQKLALFDCYRLPGVISIIFICLIIGQLLYWLVDKPAHQHCKQFLNHWLHENKNVRKLHGS
jgi:peptidoglycan/LPS O-acetylase OafA/YrhL